MHEMQFSFSSSPLVFEIYSSIIGISVVVVFLCYFRIVFFNYKNIQREEIICRKEKHMKLERERK